MTLIRRIISFLLLAVILAGTVYGLVWLRARKLKVLDPVKAIPSGVVMFVETHDFRQLISSVRHHTNIWTEFKAYHAIEQIDHQLAMVDSLGRTYSDFKELMDGEVILSVCKTDTGYSSLFILSDRQRKATEQVLKLIPSDSDIDKHRDGAVTVYHVDMPNDSLFRKFSFYECYGLFVMSPSGSLIDASVRQLNAEKHLDDNAQFTRLKGTTGSDVIANVYVNYPELGSFLEAIFRNDTPGFISRFAEWSAFDLDLKPGYITLNGFTTAGDSLHQTIRMLHGQEPVAFDMAGVVPSNAVYFSMTGFSDADLLMKNVGTYSADRERTKKLALIAKAAGEDITTAFSHLMAGEAGTVLLRRSRGDYARFFLIKVKGTAMAQEMLDAWTKVAAKAKGKEESDYSQKVNIDDHHQVVVHTSPFTGIPRLLFSRFYHKSDYEYYTYAGNYLVFGPSAEALKTYLYFNLLGKTLENDENYKSLTDNISSRSNLFIYADPSRYQEGMEKLLTPGATEVVNRHKDKWRKIDAIAFQSTSTDDLSYFRVFAHYSSQVRDRVNTVWESKLDTTTLFKPAVVINHTNNQKEIFVQDLRHTIYLISNTGSILWKQKVDGEILSGIYQIDFY
ncbi:MAG TPA: hypothetical protein VE870_14230, partial [Bacteroidales bacterium]|nr:hypothetical protein [Bacteroidales bacterium]